MSVEILETKMQLTKRCFDLYCNHPPAILDNISYKEVLSYLVNRPPTSLHLGSSSLTGKLTVTGNHG